MQQQAKHDAARGSDDTDDTDEAAAAGDGREPRAAFSRRRFLQSVGVGVSGLGVGAAEAQSSPGAALAPSPQGAGDRHPVTLKVNGTVHKITVAPNAILLDTLRDQLYLTGTKKGCDHGQCGACTLLVNGVSVNACLSLSVMHDGDEITTIEGLSRDGTLHPVQQAFWDHDAYQCGYCTAGQMMTAVGILHDRRIPADDPAVREAMSGNICRCGAYKNIVAAVQDARGKIKGTI